MDYITISLNVVIGSLIIYNLYYINMNIVDLKEILEKVF